MTRECGAREALMGVAGRQALFGTCAVLTLGTAQMAVAAEVNPEGRAVALDEIVVTAQKREATLQSVPQSVSAVSGAQMRDRGVRDVEGLTFQVPAVRFGQQAGASFVSIR